MPALQKPEQDSVAAENSFFPHDREASCEPSGQYPDVETGDLIQADLERAERDDATRVRLTEKLIEQYHEAVYRYAFWLSGCRASAEDITQEVFTRAFRAVHKLREVHAAKSWLMTITRNEATRSGRKPRPQPMGDIVETDNLVEDHSTSATEECEWVAQGLSQLSEDYRAVVLMFYFEQLTYAEIAESLEIPIGTVMSRLNRGRSQLKVALDRLATPHGAEPDQAEWERQPFADNEPDESSGSRKSQSGGRCQPSPHSASVSSHVRKAEENGGC